ncbi:MAG: ABC transporter ATP-binding protein [Caldisericum sp.]|uniref:ABC transporter ATP-binding protein n=1 Tax=Caldisericum sp. TaxID=2499687 RepID=UPI003D1038A5
MELDNIEFKSLELKDIYKEFPGVVANNKISLKINAGEIHALLGENGAGKTTLMNIIYGIYQPDDGEIFINGRKVFIDSPRTAMNYGIGMVHQHFMLVENHSVAENVALGLNRTKFLNPTEDIAKEIERYSSEIGLHVNPDAKIWQLSAGEQQRVEILKALMRGAKLLILDEPTSVLTPQEATELFKTVKKLVANGHSVIFITHKLEEVYELGGIVTVLRQGKVIGTTTTKDATKEELAKMMVGREIIFNLEKEKVEPGEVVVKVENIDVLSDKGIKAVKNLSFEIRKGEILGIAGVSGNGQKELVEALTGLRRVEKGKVIINNKEIQNRGAREIGEMGVAHIPEERIKYGIVPNFPVYENAVLRDYYKEPFSNRGFLNYKTIKDFTIKLVKDFSIATPSIETKTKLLSGGNIQKLILARETTTKSNFIVAAHPTYGLDIAATEYIRKLLLKKREEGSAILLVSEDLEEILQLSDRVAVMFMGEFMGIVDPKKVPIEEIGLMMAGSLRKQEENNAHLN